MSTIGKGLLLIWLLVSSICAYSQTGNDVIKVRCFVKFHDGNGTDLKKTRATVVVRSSEGHAPVTFSNLAISDKEGFVFSMRSVDYATIVISSSDPTIQYANSAIDEPKFYSWTEGELVPILQSEFKPLEKSLRNQELTFALERGAAIRLSPHGSQGFPGAILIRCFSRDDSGYVDVFSFSNTSQIGNTYLGGLKPGNWEIKIVDDLDVVRVNKNVTLTAGQILDYVF